MSLPFIHSLPGKNIYIRKYVPPTDFCKLIAITVICQTCKSRSCWHQAWYIYTHYIDYNAIICIQQLKQKFLVCMPVNDNNWWGNHGVFWDKFYVTIVFYILRWKRLRDVFGDIEYILEILKGGFIGFKICSFRWNHLIFFDHHPLIGLSEPCWPGF